MTNKTFNERLAKIMNEVWDLSEESGRNVNVSFHLPDEDYPDKFAMVSVGDGYLIGVHPDNSDAWKNTPSVHRSTFNYFEAVKEHKALLDWAESLKEENDA